MWGLRFSKSRPKLLLVEPSNPSKRKRKSEKIESVQEIVELKDSVTNVKKSV